nr:hypothetical protein Iba_chr12aCG14690 [Ipomoea batatas]
MGISSRRMLSKHYRNLFASLEAYADKVEKSLFHCVLLSATQHTGRLPLLHLEKNDEDSSLIQAQASTEGNLVAQLMPVPPLCGQSRSKQSGCRQLRAHHVSINALGELKSFKRNGISTRILTPDFSGTPTQDGQSSMKLPPKR